jgi:hypothetical protein
MSYQLTMLRRRIEALENRPSRLRPIVVWKLIYICPVQQAKFVDLIKTYHITIELTLMVRLHALVRAHAGIPRNLNPRSESVNCAGRKLHGGGGVKRGASQ